MKGLDLGGSHVAVESLDAVVLADQALDLHPVFVLLDNEVFQHQAKPDLGRLYGGKPSPLPVLLDLLVEEVGLLEREPPPGPMIQAGLLVCRPAGDIVHVTVRWTEHELCPYFLWDILPHGPAVTVPIVKIGTPPDSYRTLWSLGPCGWLSASIIGVPMGPPIVDMESVDMGKLVFEPS